MDFAQRPNEKECFDYHRDYIANVPNGSILETLQSQLVSATAFISAIADDQWEVIHAPFGWKVRTVIEHCCDAERVFGYRTLRFAAGDKTDLPGWDENRYAACEYCDAQCAEVLAEEFSALRTANLKLLQRIKPDHFERMGTADGRQVSVRTLAWLMAGHWAHHQRILEKRLR